VLLFLWQNAMILLNHQFPLWQVAVAGLGLALPTVWFLKFSDLGELTLQCLWGTCENLWEPARMCEPVRICENL
jgi:hypothetical protein